MRKLYLLLSFIAIAHVSVSAWAEQAWNTGGLSFIGGVKYGSDFKHFDYVNSEAPKGGVLRVGTGCNFNSLNPLAEKGQAASGLFLVYDSLLKRTLDEPFTLYPRIAEAWRANKNRTWIEFKLNKNARFHDGTSITPQDVVASYTAFKTKGPLNMRSYYRTVLGAEVTGPRTIKFSFPAGEGHQFPLLIGFMPIFSAKDIATRDTQKASLNAPLGSGPYKVGRVVPGRTVIYQKVKNYWAQSLPVNVGQNNFDEVRFDFYRDESIALEAFKAGDYDLRLETDLARWQQAYDFTLPASATTEKKSFSRTLASGMYGFVFNTRKSFFKDRQVRLALAAGLDVERLNKHFFKAQCRPVTSFFGGRSIGGEKAESYKHILEKLEPGLSAKLSIHPSIPEPRAVRGDLQFARKVLEHAGWSIKNGVLVNTETDRVLDFEILLADHAEEKLAQAYAKNLKRLGVDVRVRIVDATHYQSRLNSFDFDMIIHRWPQSMAPGKEQLNYWGSFASKAQGSRNYAGVNDPHVDSLIHQLISTKEEQEYKSIVLALDHVLMAGNYIVPLLVPQQEMIAVRKTIGFPKQVPDSGIPLHPWWTLTSTFNRMR